MTYRFISDLHLDASRPMLCQGFFDYLDRIKSDTERLYILGDLFELWIGDDDDAPFHRKVLERLKNFSDEGVALFIMHGNRDFLIGEDFAAFTGSTLITEPYRLTLGDHQYLLMHGDSLCTDDTDYQAFKQQIRNPQSIAFLLSQTLEQRRALASSMRENTQKAVTNKAMAIMDVNQQAVESTFKTHNYPTLIHGHTHKPAIHDYNIDGKAVKRYVLGDWDSHGYELVLTPNNNLTLEKFCLKDQHDTSDKNKSR